MPFYEVLKILMTSAPIAKSRFRRKSWKNKYGYENAFIIYVYIGCDSGAIMICLDGHNGIVYRPISEDLTANDWEEYK